MKIFQLFGLIIGICCLSGLNPFDSQQVYIHFFKLNLYPISFTIWLLMCARLALFPNAL